MYVVPPRYACIAYCCYVLRDSYPLVYQLWLMKLVRLGKSDQLNVDWWLFMRPAFRDRVCRNLYRLKADRSSGSGREISRRIDLVMQTVEAVKGTQIRKYKAFEDTIDYYYFMLYFQEGLNFIDNFIKSEMFLTPVTCKIVNGIAR